LLEAYLPIAFFPKAQNIKYMAGLLTYCISTPSHHFINSGSIVEIFFQLTAAGTV